MTQRRTTQKPSPSRKGKRNKKKGGIDKKDLYVIVSIIAITTFTSVAVVLQFVKEMEISSQLTICWYSFWGTELIALTSIKHKEIPYETDDEEESPALPKTGGTVG